MKKRWLLPLTAVAMAATALAANATAVQEEDLGKIAFDIGHIQTEWTPDGVLTEGEYTRIERKTSWLSATTSDDTWLETARNLEFDLGLSWDAEYVYTFVQFTDPNGHVSAADNDPSMMWATGCLQVCYSDADKTGHDRMEYGIARSSETGKYVSHLWENYLGVYYLPEEDKDVLCTVDGDVVTYEFRTPFTAFSTLEPQTGNTYGLCYVISWGNCIITEDGSINGDFQHTQLASGCTGFGKAAQNFAKFTLVDSTEYDAAVEIATDIQNVREGDEFTYDILLSGTYNGFSFTIDAPQDMTITGVAGGEAIGERNIDVTALSNGRYRVSAFPGREQVNAPQTRIATVTLSVNAGIAVGTQAVLYPDSSVTQIADTKGDAVSVRLRNADYIVIAFVEGDVNADGIMDYYDMTRLYSILRESAAVTNVRIADVNGDGVFDYLDITKLYALVRQQ